MVICTDPREAFDYVLAEDRDNDSPTTFWLRALTSLEEREILSRLNKLAKSEDADAGLLDLRQETLKKHLEHWEGMTNRAGKAVELVKDNDGTVSDASLNLLSSSWRIELFNAVLSRGKISVKESD